MKNLILSLFSFGIAICGISQTVTDSFNGNQVNTVKWEAIAAFGDTTVAENNGMLSLRNGAKILTQVPFGSPIEINGRFRFSGNVHDNFIIVFRTTSATYPGNSIELTNGIAIRIEPVNDTSSSFCTFIAQRMNDSYQFAVTNRTFAMNQFYNFRLTDSGTNFSFFFDDMTTPLLSGSDTLFVGQRVGFYNRPGNGGGSSISDGSQVDIDYLHIASPPRNQGQFPFDLDLVAFYPLDGDAIDASGNGNHGVVFNTDLVSDRFSIANKAMRFGVNKYIEVPSAASLLFSNQLTISAWIKKEDICNCQFSIISKILGDGWTGGFDFVMFGDLLGPGSDGIVLEGDFSQGTEPGGSFPHGWVYAPLSRIATWRHVAVVYSNSVTAFWVDGVVSPLSYNTAAGNIGQSSIPLRIGRRQSPNDNWFSGSIDDIRIYNRALSSNEVAQLYALEAPERIDIKRAVYLDSSGLRVGTNYQLQISADLNLWTNHGGVFTATNSSWRTTNYWDVDNGNSLFFRLQRTP